MSSSQRASLPQFLATEMATRFWLVGDHAGPSYGLVCLQADPMLLCVTRAGW
jgi:hypothetical protein